MNISTTFTPNSDYIDFLTQKINEEMPQFKDSSSFGFLMRDEKNQVIAGISGFIAFGSMYTAKLWVHPDHRKSGFGRKLLLQAHDYARQNECAMATVATMNFQGALAFYEKLGYLVEFERPGYINDSYALFLRKDL